MAEQRKKISRKGKVLYLKKKDPNFYMSHKGEGVKVNFPFGQIFGGLYEVNFKPKNLHPTICIAKEVHIIQQLLSKERHQRSGWDWEVLQVRLESEP